ncbi:glycoside hydrolase family 43 protein [Cylindrobasidium torrendii FP15055 ss-10]|uniref:Glycoside hydrolase family 43 protein n=1 Tax=Cylindrobasidium torrendii FP15055 ss-10 TaxID=1314674 RepID=A0A0D7BJF1_9AGAR|nr:glycoside hydrolase family 43 protein [Cylindrobasidium torrendii FP15055 ss-10]
MFLLGTLTTVLYTSGVLAAAVSGHQDVEERQTEDYAGYGFIYFIGEKYATGEQIYFAASNGNTPAAWNIVNGGKPVLTSTLGDKGVRDPYIIRHPTSGTFYVVATDLKVNGSGKSWDYLSRQGSRSLAIWESKDLVNWSDQRLVELAPPEAGMAWAPEATWDPVAEHFVVYWASKLYESTDTNHTGSSYSRQLYSNTTDFVTFTEAEVWIDRGNDNIDTTVCLDPETKYYHRFSKADGKWVIQERALSLFAEWETVFEGVGYSDHGQVEGPLCFTDNLDASLTHVWVDDIADRAGEVQGYIPYQTTNLTSGAWTLSEGYTLPTDPRHGTVFALTARELEALSSISV